MYSPVCKSWSLGKKLPQSSPTLHQISVGYFLIGYTELATQQNRKIQPLSCDLASDIPQNKEGVSYHKLVPCKRN